MLSEEKRMSNSIRSNRELDVIDESDCLAREEQYDLGRSQRDPEEGVDRTLVFHESKNQNDMPLVQPRKKSITDGSVSLRTKDIDDHYLTLFQVSERYKVELDFQAPWKSFGLSDQKATELLQEHGFNRLTSSKRVHPMIMFLHEFKNPLTLILLICGVLSFVLYAFDTQIKANLYLGAVLIVVTVLNALIEFAQLQKSAAILDSFNNLIPLFAIVIREGRQQRIPIENIVKGDLIYLKDGDKVPADTRIVSGKNFKVDNSSLTGESDPRPRSHDPSIGHVSVVEAENLAFGGTTVVAGEAYAVVIRCGDDTVLGEIAAMTTVEKRSSPLTQETERLVKFISIASGIMAITFFVIGMIIDPSFSRNFNFLIGIFVANIPQGLPVTVTLLLSFAVKRMAAKNVLVKDLQAVDTLGSITMLASDKTGTMTQNKMTVVHTWINSQHYEQMPTRPNDIFSSDPSKLSFNLSVAGAKELIETCYICNKAKFDASQENMNLDIQHRKVFGDATESGLLKFASGYFEDSVMRGVDEIKIFEVPFNSTNKWALTIVSSNHGTGSLVLYMKGAPERVFEKCDSIYDKGISRPLHRNDRINFEEAYEVMASLGQRVLAFAFKPLPAEYDSETVFSLDPPDFPSDGLIFLGLVGLMDPPKDRVAEAIKACRSAQIQVMMITGDHPFTAEAIARKVGLITGDTIERAAEKLGKPISLVKHDEFEAVVVHGDKIDSMTNSEWSAVLRKKEVVFARTSPIHKLQIVARCQAMGHIVAVTGDGVNDSPALKKADLGISMGISGSDISKEVAGMILLDDNFATIVDGIKEGRLIYANLQKTIRYILTHIAAEVWPFLLYIAFGLPLALSSLQILLIDLGTELPPALSFSWEPVEDDIMSKPPRRQVIRPKEPLVVSSEDAKNLSRIPSFVIKSVDIPTPIRKTRRWWEVRIPATRKVHDESLVDKKLLLWSYLQGGTIEALAGFFGFFWIFGTNGIGFTFLWGLARPNHAYGSEITQDAVINNTIYSGSELSRILGEAQTAYFVSIVIVQYFVLYVSRSKIGYPWGKKMWKNHVAYLSFILSFGWAMFCTYVPFMNIIIGTKPLAYQGYVPAIVGGVVVILYEFAIVFLRNITLGFFASRALPEVEPISPLIRSLSLNKSLRQEFFPIHHDTCGSMPRLSRSLSLNKSLNETFFSDAHYSHSRIRQVSTRW